MAHDIGAGVVAVGRDRRPLHGRLPTPQTVSYRLSATTDYMYNTPSLLLSSNDEKWDFEDRLCCRSLETASKQKKIPCKNDPQKLYTSVYTYARGAFKT